MNDNIEEIKELEKDIVILAKEREDIENEADDQIDQYDSCLNSSGTVMIAGMEMYPATILRECDIIAYNEGYNDFFDERLSEIAEEIERKEEEIKEMGD